MSNIVFAYIAHAKFQKASFNSNRDIRQNIRGDGGDRGYGDRTQNNTSRRFQKRAGGKKCPTVNFLTLFIWIIPHSTEAMQTARMISDDCWVLINCLKLLGVRKRNKALDQSFAEMTKLEREEFFNAKSGSRSRMIFVHLRCSNTNWFSCQALYNKASYVLFHK